MTWPRLLKSAWSPGTVNRPLNDHQHSDSQQKLRTVVQNHEALCSQTKAIREQEIYRFISVMSWCRSWELFLEKKNKKNSKTKQDTCAFLPRGKFKFSVFSSGCLEDLLPALLGPKPHIVSVDVSSSVAWVVFISWSWGERDSPLRHRIVAFSCYTWFNLLERSHSYLKQSDFCKKLL